MKKIILTESQLKNIANKIIKEQEEFDDIFQNSIGETFVTTEDVTDVVTNQIVNKGKNLILKKIFPDHAIFVTSNNYSLPSRKHKNLSKITVSINDVIGKMQLKDEIIPEPEEGEEEYPEYDEPYYNPEYSFNINESKLRNSIKKVLREEIKPK
jgi:hypothetical protein